jgi:hypothetical protein
MPAEQTQKSLFGLLCTGIIEYLPGPAKKARAAPVKAAPGRPPPPPRAPPRPPPPPTAPSSARDPVGGSRQARPQPAAGDHGNLRRPPGP